MKPLADHDNSPRKLINRKSELELIETALSALIGRKNILSTPIVDFFGIAGIGKTRILQEIANMCLVSGLLCIKLDENQTHLDGRKNISSISRTILQQANKLKSKTSRSPSAKKSDVQTQTVEAVKTLLENRPVVILLDSIDASNDTLVNWIEETLGDLMQYNNLFVVLTSKQRIVFENDWSIIRKLTPFQLRPLNRDDSRSYIDSLDCTISSDTRDVIFQWTRGHPFAMETMAKAIVQHRFDIERSEDQQQLITIIIEEVIDKKVLARVDPSQLEWCKACLLLLSMPRRFKVTIMEGLFENFGSPAITKVPRKLEYIGLLKRLSENTDVLYWDRQKAGYTIDESIRNIFLIYQQLHHHSLFIAIHKHLAEKNIFLAT